jgi:hypothetical protein
MQKGQMTIIGIIMVVMTIIVFAAMSPILHTAIANATVGADETTSTVLNLIPFAIVIAILISIFTYAQPYIERIRGQ